eukprot:362691-Amorphochlora_amoeboformis.AAC.1
MLKEGNLSAHTLDCAKQLPHGHRTILVSATFPEETDSKGNPVPITHPPTPNRELFGTREPITERLITAQRDINSARFGRVADCVDCQVELDENEKRILRFMNQVARNPIVVRLVKKEDLRCQHVCQISPSYSLRLRTSLITCSTNK